MIGREPLELWIVAALVALGLGAIAPSGRAVGAEFDQVCASLPQPGGARTLSANPDSLRRALKDVRDGDTILLQDGDYGSVVLQGANATFVTVTAAPGKHPVLAGITIRGSHWAVRGLTVDGFSPGGREVVPPAQPGRWPAHPPLVAVQGGDNIAVIGNTVRSVPGEYPWAPQQLGADPPTPIRDGVNVSNTACVTIGGNRISNVFNGLSLEGDQVGDRGRYFRVTMNTINDFAGDGIDHSVSDALISQNLITNSHDVCDYKCVHTDGVQGWNFHNHPGITNSNIVIERNIIIQRAKLDLPMASGNLQGVTIFDGSWRNIKIANNVIVTNAWHGVTVGGTDGLYVINNTVLSTNDHGTWISAGGRTGQGVLSRNVVVRNNIAMAVVKPRTPAESYVADHNVELVDPRLLFERFDAKEGAFDLHPRSKASVIVGKGSPNEAPATDIDGRPRRPSVDIGAYQAVR